MSLFLPTRALPVSLARQHVCEPPLGLPLTPFPPLIIDSRFFFSLSSHVRGVALASFGVPACTARSNNARCAPSNAAVLLSFGPFLDPVKKLPHRTRQRARADDGVFLSRHSWPILVSAFHSFSFFAISSSSDSGRRQATRGARTGFLQRLSLSSSCVCVCTEEWNPL